MCQTSSSTCIADTLNNSLEAEAVELSCLVYCSIFPEDYEIDKDTLVQLWMAAGFISNEPMEDVSAEYLQVLEGKGIISISRKDLSSGKVWYKIKHFSLPQDLSSGISHVKVDAGNPPPPPYSDEKPCDVVTVGDSLADFEVLKRFSDMKTLLFVRGHGSCFKRVPYDLFILLKKLVTLDSSETKLSELPSSIGNLKCL